MQYREAADLLGLTLREMVALHGRVRSASLSRLQGYNGSWSHAAASFGNMFYVTLLAETWQQVTIGGVLQYKANGKDMYSPIITVLRSRLSDSDVSNPVISLQLHGARRPQPSVDARSSCCGSRICS